MKLVLTAALCLIPALSFAGEKPTEEPTLAKPAVAVDQEVVEEVASESDCTIFPKQGKNQAANFLWKVKEPKERQ